MPRRGSGCPDHHHDQITKPADRLKPRLSIILAIIPYGERDAVEHLGGVGEVQATVF